MDNQVIKVLTPAHGEKVIKYWKDMGVDVRGFVGSCSEADGAYNNYYGIINNYFDNYGMRQVSAHGVKIITLPDFVLPKKWCIKATPATATLILKYFNDGCGRDTTNGYCILDDYYHYPCFAGAASFKFGQHSTTAKQSNYTEITFEQFEKYVLKEINMKKTGLDFMITPAEANMILAIACVTWKLKLAKLWALHIVMNEKISVTNAFYKEMRVECTTPQHELFDKIFGKDEEFYPDGTPCLVKGCVNDGWNLRYANGKGQFYTDGRKSGNVETWSYHHKLDIENLPVNS